MSVKKIILALSATLVIGTFTVVGIADAVKTTDIRNFADVQLKSKSAEIKELNVKYEKLNLDLDKASKDKNLNQEQLDKLNKEKQELEKQKKELEVQLQAKIDTKNRLAVASAKAVNAVTGTETAYASSGIDCLNQTTAKAFIYCHESGNTSTSVNSIGACGLGQALPCSKMPCSLQDYSCQDNWFTNSYMAPRYGSWEAAKAFWLSHGYACSNDVGWCGWW